MKTIYLLVTGIFWVSAVNAGMAQKNKQTFPNDSVEKKYYAKTYVVNFDQQNNLRASDSQPPSVSIYNHDLGELAGHSSAGGCYDIKETTPLTDVIKKVLSKEKIKALALDKKNNIVIKFNYDMNTGQVVHLQFILHVPFSEDLNSETSLTLRDINQLESLYKEYHFYIPEGCVNREARDANDHFGNWVKFFWFYKLVDEEPEKSK
ncbi:MAG: hypothetical protein LBH19_13860 [Dysgonamonadaceae bacterium]|jgi:hypothetical protein|nr:hypothetical protein [Dysgonamonadaceae bacterium]